MIGAAETSTAQKILVPIGAVLGAVLLALLLAVLVGALVRSLVRRSVVAADLVRRTRRPLRAVLVVIAVWVALRVSVPDTTWDGSSWMSVLEHALLITLIGTSTWLLGTLAFVVEDLALSRYRVDVKDNRHARRVRTQIQLLRRITVAVLVIVAAAAALLTFPGVSAFGASLLASAGVLSIVAGLAAQSTLSNVFAGLQLAFTDAIRVDDVVIVSDEWGRIEEITLTYVVVHVWDDRRLILPSTHFTQTPFENWTRRAAELLGTVELDVDWQVPVDAMRGELNRLLGDTDLWDGRVGILQVTDAVGGSVRLRALASAVDAPTLFDLRCYLREGLVVWLQRSAPQGLPRTRVETSQAAPLPDPPAGAPPTTDGRAARTAAVVEPPRGQQDARLFTGTLEAVERSRSFVGPGQEVIDEREEHAAAVRAEQQEEDAVPRTSVGRGPSEPDEGTGVAGPRRTGGAAGAEAPSGADDQSAARTTQVPTGRRAVSSFGTDGATGAVEVVQPCTDDVAGSGTAVLPAVPEVPLVPPVRRSVHDDDRDDVL